MKCEKNSFKSYSSPSFISQGLSSASEKNVFLSVTFELLHLHIQLLPKG